MKKIYSFLIMALIICTFSVTALAKNDNSAYPRLIDDADVISSSDETDITNTLDEISEKYKVDVIAVVVNDIEGSSVRAYADDLYDNLGYGYGSNHDGVLLLIALNSRDWYISTCGYGITAFTDYGIQYIGEQITPSLSDRNYAQGKKIYAEKADMFIEKAKDGHPVKSKSDLPKGPFPWLYPILAALLVSGIRVLSLYGQLKSVRKQQRADYYTREGSMHITDSREFYLYRTVDRTRKPQNNGGSGSSTHVSSSGVTHGGGGGKF